MDASAEVSNHAMQVVSIYEMVISYITNTMRNTRVAVVFIIVATFSSCNCFIIAMRCLFGASPRSSRPFSSFRPRLSPVRGRGSSPRLASPFLVILLSPLFVAPRLGAPRPTSALRTARPFHAQFQVLVRVLLSFRRCMDLLYRLVAVVTLEDAEFVLISPRGPGETRFCRASPRTVSAKWVRTGQNPSAKVLCDK